MQNNKIELYSIKIKDLSQNGVQYEINNKNILSNDTLMNIVRFVDCLITIDKITESLPLYISESKPLLTISLRDNEILFDCDYDLDNEFGLSSEVTKICDLVYLDILDKFKPNIKN